MYLYELFKDTVTNRPYLIFEDKIDYPCKSINSPMKIMELMKNCFEIDKKCVEEAYLIVMASDCSVLGMFKLSTGTISSTVLDTRGVFQRVFMLNGAYFTVVHNHPSGNPKPSEADLLICKRLQDAGKIMGVDMLDFIIVGNNSYYSHAEEGLI